MYIHRVAPVSSFLAARSGACHLYPRWEQYWSTFSALCLPLLILSFPQEGCSSWFIYEGCIGKSPTPLALTSQVRGHCVRTLPSSVLGLLSPAYSHLLTFKRSLCPACPAFLLLLGLAGQFRMGRKRHCGFARHEKEVGLWSALDCLRLCSNWIEPGREKGSAYAPFHPQQSVTRPGVFCQNEINVILTGI